MTNEENNPNNDNETNPPNQQPQRRIVTSSRHPITSLVSCTKNKMHFFWRTSKRLVIQLTNNASSFCKQPNSSELDNNGYEQHNQTTPGLLKEISLQLQEFIKSTHRKDFPRTQYIEIDNAPKTVNLIDPTIN